MSESTVQHVLIVDDDLSYLLGIAERIVREGFTASTAPTLREAREELAKHVPDLVLLDSNLPDGHGIELLGDLAVYPRTEVVFITGHGSIEAAVEAIQLGATNYLTKPIEFERIKAVLAAVARTRELKEEIGSLRGELRKLGRFGPLIGVSPAMQKLYDLIARVAPTDATIMLAGETGTGKEVVAATIHSLSRRRKGAFVPLNCGAVSPNLIESELFGHEKGSFTGADRTRHGVFERANKGTLFLDEITEMPIELQVKLLRVLESRSFLRVGGQQAIETDVRVVAATNRSPADAVAEGRLRQDLFFRLNVFPILVPPLRDRLEDVELLAQHFLEELCSQEGVTMEFSRAALQRLSGHSWPGNVRELRNVVHRAFILASDVINVDHLSLGKEEVTGTSLSLKVGLPLDELERSIILATLEQCEGDKKNTADVLGISLKTLYNKLNIYKANTTTSSPS